MTVDTDDGLVTETDRLVVERSRRDEDENVDPVFP